MAFELGWDEIPRISSQALKSLEAYPWPGNIRELKNVIERAVYKSSAGEIKKVSFNPFNNPYEKIPENRVTEKENGVDESKPGEFVNILDHILKKPFKEAVGELERFLLSRALKECRFNQKKAAQKLGLSYDQFRGIRKKYAGRV